MPKLNRRKFMVASGAATALASSAALGKQRPLLTVKRLTVDFVDGPVALENRQPRFSWQLESDARNARQTAYRILVATSAAALRSGRGDLWDSGKVAARSSIGIRYRGAPLQSRQKCWWCVRVWGEGTDASDYSEPAFWEMGLLSAEDWQAQWLAAEDALAREDRAALPRWIWGSTTGPAVPRKFRLVFDLPAPAAKVTLLLGAKDLLAGASLDGELIPVEPRERYFNSGSTTRQFELRPLPSGRHVLAAEVAAEAESVLAAPAKGLIALLRVVLEDGRTLRIPSGSAWKTSLADDPSWMKIDFDDRSWESAREVTGRLTIDLPPLPAMYLRKEFAVEAGEVVRARLYAASLGFYEASINARRVGDALMTSELSQYQKRVLYRVYEVTTLLKSGRNAIGLMVGDGWYAADMPSAPGGYSWGEPPRRALAQLEIEFSDGSRQVIASGPGWRIAPSPIVQSDIYDGEIYDARLEQAGWDSVGFDDSRWEDARIAEKPGGRLVAQVSPPIRAMQTLKPQRITEPKPGVWVVDFGQNFAGWCRLRTRGPNGTRIELRFAEALQASGEVDQSDLFGAKQTDVLILKGDAREETFEPRFTYHGFRYVQVSGAAQAFDPDSIVGVVLHNDLEITGRLEVRHPLIQQIWKNTLWSQRSNFIGVPTDCPQRRERLSWMGDVGFFWESACYNMNLAAFSRRHLDDIADAQTHEGVYPTSAPNPYQDVIPTKVATPAWADAALITAWTHWQRYGDVSVIEEHWDGMHRYVQFVLGNNPDHIWRNKRGSVGDHCSVDYKWDGVPTTPHDVFGTAYWACSVSLLAQMAEAIGRSQEAKTLRQLRASIRDAFIKEFVAADGRVGNGSQTGYVLALHFDLIPQELCAKAAAHLVADIRRRGSALSTGMAGTQFLIDVLCDAGYVELAYDLILRTQYPSWGHMIEQGATTIWESWDGRMWSGVKGQTMPASQNHFAFGSIVGFFYRRIAGIDVMTPGYEKILVRPVLDARIRSAAAHYLSILGRIWTSWEQTGDSFTLDVTIPANATAEVHLPAGPGDRIYEGRRDISSSKDVRVSLRKPKETVVEIGSGTYRFRVDTRRA